MKLGPVCIALRTSRPLHLVATQCVLLRDYLSDTPMSHGMGLWVSQSEELECDIPCQACKFEVR